MRTYEDELAIVIGKWITTNQKLKEINKYLYEHTELFECKYEQDYQTELYNCFAKKITRFTKDEKEIYEKMKTSLKNKVRLEVL